MSDIPKVGDIFDDKYEILEILGSGGNGTVYKALQLDCQRIVALKILHLQTASDEEYRARFLREAKSLSAISHPNIITVYHMGLSAANLPYLAMELVEGKSLRAVMNETTPLPLRLALEITHEAALAMAHVHSKNIVHRDLKPENILILQKPEPNTVKILDFGLAHVDETIEQKLTRTGQLIGTSQYMSPEQCMGKAIDFRSDIYSLTSCLYEMIAGKPAFESDNAIGMMYKQIKEAVPPLDKQRLKLANVSQLNAFIARGMAKYKEQRFSSMTEMGLQIEQILSEIPGNAEETDSSHQLLPIGFTIGIVVLSLAAIAFAAALQQRTTKAPALSTIPAAPVVSGIPAEAGLKLEKEYQRHKRLLFRAEMSSGKESLAVALEIDELARLLLYSGKAKDALNIMQSSLSIKKRLLDADALALGRSYSIIANCYAAENNWSEAGIAKKHEIEILIKHKDSSEATLRESYSQLAWFLSKQGKQAEAEIYGKQMVERSERTDDKVQFANRLWQLADIYNGMSQPAKARQFYQRALELKTKYLPLDNHDLGINCFHYGQFEVDNNQPEQGLKLMERSWIILQKHKVDADTCSLATVLGNTYAMVGNTTKAEEYFQRSLSMQEKIGWTQLPSYLWTLDLLGDLYAKIARNAEAESIFKKSIQERLKQGNADPLDICNAYVRLGSCYEAQGKSDRARQEYTSAEKYCQLSLKTKETEEKSVNALLRLAWICEKLAKVNEAEQTYSRILELHKRNLLTASANLYCAVDHLATLKGNAGRRAEAEILYKEALRLAQGNKVGEARVQFDLGGFYIQTKRAQLAEPLLIAAEKTFRELLPTSSERLAKATRLADTYLLLQKKKEAEQVLKDLLKVEENAAPCLWQERNTISLCLLYLQQGETAKAKALLPEFCKNASRVSTDIQLLCDVYTAAHFLEDKTRTTLQELCTNAIWCYIPRLQPKYVKTKTCGASTNSR